MSNELSCTWEEFRVIARDFLQAAPTALDLDSLDNGYKCLGLAYLNCQYEEGALGEHYRNVQGPLLLKMATRAFLQRESELS